MQTAAATRTEEHSLGVRDRPSVRSVPDCTERKSATVLFVDVMGSMDLSGSIELEQWWSVIAVLYELMCDGVYRFDGWVGNFTGDGIKAVFEAGSPKKQAFSACRSALWLRDAIEGPAEDLRREHGLELSVRIGINSGEIVTGTIGDRYSRYYTASGYAVALAKRVEGLAPAGCIYLTEHTATLLGRPAALRELGRFDVKGARDRVCVFELVGTGRAR